MNTTACCCGPSQGPTRVQQIKYAVGGFLMSLYRRHGYRHVMRTLHKFDLHHAPIRPRLDGDFEVLHHHRCDWCGLEGTTVNMERFPFVEPKKQIT
jgi:hypothetical protein